MKYFFWLMCAILLASCGTNRVFEEHVDFKENYWLQSEEVTFNFEITDSEVPYDLFASFRNASAYPYHNLYYQYTLADSSGQVIRQDLRNINLFDPKTGEPLGSGLGDIFDHQQLIVDDITFEKTGTYQLSLAQYMRRDTLPLLLSVGARVEWAAAD